MDLVADRRLSKLDLDRARWSRDVKGGDTKCEDPCMVDSIGGDWWALKGHVLCLFLSGWDSARLSSLAGYGDALA